MFGPEDEEEARDVTDTSDDGSDYQDRVNDALTGGLEQDDQEE